MDTIDTTVWVRYAETDQMGVVYYANYLVFFEVGRNVYFNSIGSSYADMEREGVYFPVIESHCVYRHPARYGDNIVIKTAVAGMKPTRVKIVYEILRSKDNLLLAQGYTEHAFMSKEGRPLNISKTHPHIWEKLKKVAS
ncbi:MAG: acyl-CoA thioester hydrolase [Thermoanaerobacteraceae bacterium]|nr:acyl-CoA thioester hydrolase [Thermoanaerobacteraceae bacterium]